MAATVKVVRFNAPTSDDSSSADTYAKAVSDAVGDTAGDVTSVASVWDPIGNAIVTTIVIHDS